MSVFHAQETEAKSRVSMRSAASSQYRMDNMMEGTDSRSSNRMEYLPDELVTPVKKVRDPSGVF